MAEAKKVRGCRSLIRINRRPPWDPVAAAFVLLVSGCAATEPHPNPSASPVISRGHAVAQQLCAACHAVEPGGASPRPAAPPFASLEMRHTAGLQGRVADLTRNGHCDMPRIHLRDEDVADLVAYIASLDGR